MAISIFNKQCNRNGGASLSGISNDQQVEGVNPQIVCNAALSSFYF